MSKVSKGKCLLPRAVKNPKAFLRWMKSYLRRVRQTEQEIGEELHPC